ncbi:MAG: hypothetical protein EZS28_003544 [Streblomastix strix]|uniref:Exonuclease n=1 Tax=Streblomastix strix TaxID=222440 RepID=A0A5J4X2G1_9EUKA|nr:MAG: hypothetical protein EZS28_003544 [Streblomastix strix]
MENISDQECKKQLQLIQEITSQNNRSEFIAHGLPYKEIVAISCEFVQSEETYGSKTSLSKISLVDYSGAVLLDSKVKNDSNSEDQKDQRLKYQVVRAKALSLIYGKVLVGYQLETCLKILNMNRPDCMLRDIQICPYLRDKSVSKGEGLNLMVKRILGKDMQEEMNNTLDNGRAIMCLYRLIEELWENDFAKQTAEKLKNKETKKNKIYKSKFILFGLKTRKEDKKEEKIKEKDQIGEFIEVGWKDRNKEKNNKIMNI